MSTNPPAIGYPIFEANQVLKDTDLNRLFDYLDSQQRLTRTHLIGMGIICGLEVSVNLGATPAIALSSGYGLTSEGYLLALEATQLTHYLPPRPVPTQLFAPTPTPPNPGESLSFYTVTELFAQGGDAQGGDERRPLNQTASGGDRSPEALQAFLTNQVLVVLLELEDQRRDSCLIDCDDQGKDRSFRLRFFLLPRTQTSETGSILTADYLLRQGYSLDQLPTYWRSRPINDIFTARQRFFQQFELRVRRFGYTTETVAGESSPVPVIRLNQFKTYDEFCKGYYDVCVQAIEAIATTFPQLFQLFSPLFAPFQPNPTDFNGLRTRLSQRLQKIWSPANSDPSTLEAVEAQYALQYFYDYLSQLVAAYEELAHAAFDLLADCDPDLSRFPKFLMLGVLPLTASAPCAVPSPYRSHFTQPPLYNGNALRVKQVRHLYERLVQLCANESFLLLPFYDTPLKITPSKDRSLPLSEQAIPYYLNYPALYLYWSYEACRKGISDRHPAYFYPRTTGTPIDAADDLVHRLDAYNFYRIEGHIGEGTRNALEQVRTYQQRYNLPFDILVLKLGTSTSFQDLNISGQLDDLEADFGRMKDRFLKLWDKNRERWSRNALLNTLKQVFFDQASLSNITDTQLFNTILSLAGQAEQYQFVEETIEGESTQRYRLYLLNKNGVEIARYQREGEDAETLIDFSDLSSDEIENEKQRIANEFAACFVLRTVLYGVERQNPNNPFSYHLRLSADAEFNLPRNPETNRPRGTAPITLRSLGFFTISFDSNNQPIIYQTEFQDFETLYGLLRDVPEAYTSQQKLPFNLGDRHAADCLNYFEFKGLMEVYQQRLEKLMELHLFHKFADLHPGMEHLGGVPRGGTFILVYVDGEEVVNNLLNREREVGVRSRTSVIREFATFPFSLSSIASLGQEALNRADIVIADFCVPYRCNSTSPAISYVLTQPRPIVLLEKTAFCEDDETEYEFLLDPPGGLLKGGGSYQKQTDQREEKYYFQPSRIEQDVITDLAITFTYVVEGSFDTFTVLIYPEPIAELSISDGANFCNNADPLPLSLRKGTDPAIQLLQVTVNGEAIQQLDPKRYAQNGEPETLELQVKLRDRRTNCENTVTRTVTINPLPDPGFEFRPAPNQSGGYCAEGKGGETAITLVPNQPDFSEGFRVAIGNQETPASQILLREFASITSPIDLKVTHTANRVGCQAQDSKTITIFPRPDASFDLSASRVCSDGEPIEITLNPNNPDQPKGRLQAFDPSGKSIPEAIQDDPPRFLPAAVKFGEENRLSIKITYTTQGEGGCSNVSDRTITVLRTPVAGFKTRIISESPNEAIVEVFNIRPQDNDPSLIFLWETPGGTRKPENPRNAVFRITYSPEEENQEVTITLKVENQFEKTQCEGEPFSKSISLNFNPPDDDNPDDDNPDGDDPDEDDPDGDNPDGGGVVEEGGGSDVVVLLDRRRETYRTTAINLRQTVGVRDNVTDEQFADRFLTLDRTIDETQAIQNYETVIPTLLKLYPQSTEERQAAIAQLIALSTASLFDRLAIGTLTDDLITRLKGTFDSIREVGIDQNIIRSTWNPSVLISGASEEKLDQLDQLDQLLQ